ncbi:hypothetical protein GCM10022226_58410 [Sphaerisporangium flaviroseum]|uniref:Allene oxide cyclase n=1 Tax=Sphaerisporangium flaviroseum TaxID=509199 RepID=A0ABP7IY02_9ACTN
MSGFSLRRRSATTALVIAFLGVSIAIVPPDMASASPLASTSTSTPAPKRKSTELIFYADKVVNTQPGQIKAGDSWVTYLSLFDVKKKRAGDGSARCSAVQATPQGVIAQCTHVLRTKRGQITLLGMDDWAGNPPWTSSAAITGGTDHYAGMTGSARITVSAQHVIIKIRPIG